MRLSKFFAVASVPAIMFGLSEPLHAQTTSQGPDGKLSVLPEIVVTAQRRSESIQKTSVVVSVIGKDELARAGVTSLDDITRVAPGVQIATATSAPQIYIRGVGDFAATALNNPAIAINIDGVYAARPDSMPADLYDLERIEVLKGPQGTLYGRNASGGALNLITAKPVLNLISAGASAEFGNYDAVNLNGFVNIPIGDTLALRIAGDHVTRDGYTGDFNDENHDGIRLRAFWKPSNVFNMLLNFSYGHTGGVGSAPIISNNAGAPGPFVDSLGAEGRAYVYSAIPNGAQGGPDERAEVVLPNGQGAFYNNNFYNVSAEINADLGFAKLTFIPAYRDSSISHQSFPFVEVGFGQSFLIPINNAAPPSPANETTLPAHPETSKATSLELRLANENKYLKWVVGGYYYNEKQYVQDVINSGPLQDIGTVANLSTEAYAGFAQATYSVFQNFRLIGGIRYTSDQRVLSNGATYAQPNSIFGFAGPNGATFAPATPPGTYPPFTPIPGPPFAVLEESYAGSKTFDNTSWKAGAEYDISPTSLLFFTAATGFKAGGFNQLAAYGAPGIATEFKPEELTSYDVGLKNRFFNNRLQLNFGGFYWDYRNQQLPEFGINSVGGIGIEFINAQKATIYGANADLTANLWTGGRVNASVEYAHGSYDQFVVQSAQVPAGSTGCTVSQVTPVQIGPAGPVDDINCAGKQLPRTPLWSGSAGASQDILNLGNNGLVTLEGDLTFASSRQLTIDYIAASKAQPYVMLNSNLTYATSGGNSSITLFVRNITNAEVYTAASEPNFAPGVELAYTLPPRTYGIRLSHKF